MSTTSLMPEKRSRLAVARLIMLVAVLATIGLVLAFSGTDGFRDLLTDVGSTRWGFIAFVLVYAFAVVVLLPGTLGTLTAGAVFGFPLGGFAALAGASIGATLAFLISRSMGRDGAQSLVGDRLGAVDEWVGRNDFSSVLVLRLMPVVPFNLLNYGAGLTSVRLSRYVVASIVGMAPGTFLTTALADEADEPFGAPFLILLALFFVALVGSIVIGRHLQNTRRAQDLRRVQESPITDV